MTTATPRPQMMARTDSSLTVAGFTITGAWGRAPGCCPLTMSRLMVRDVTPIGRRLSMAKIAGRAKLWTRSFHWLRAVTQVAFHPFDPQSKSFASVYGIGGCVRAPAKGHELSFDSVIFQS